MAQSVLLNNQITTTVNEVIYEKCVIGLDRDGVINEDLSDYCYRTEDFKPIPGSLEAISYLRNKGHKIVIITDQGGIEKGVYTPQDVDHVHNFMLQLLGQAGCPSIDAIYYSASSRKDDIYAKPNTGMFDRCEREYPHIKFKDGFYVGDRLKDLKVAVKIGAIPVLVRSGHGVETEKELNKWTNKDIKKKTLIFDNLAHFAENIF